MLRPYQFLVVAVAGFFVLESIARYRRRTPGATLPKVLFRVLVWGGIGAVTVMPAVTFTIARIIGMEGNINAVVFLGFLLLFLLVFKLYAALERLERDLTRLVRTDALANSARASDRAPDSIAVRSSVPAESVSDSISVRR